MFSNYPTALLAVPVALLAADRLRPSRVALAAALTAAALCLATPFTVEQADLDARPRNAIPALGVALTIALVVRAWRRFPRGGGRLAGDGVRIVLALAAGVLAIPWMFAELGFYAPDPILADERPPGEQLAAVHLGRHHGMDGVLVALGALAFSRALPAARGALREAASLLLALALAYGVANAVQDAWLEQVEKRGWVDWGLASVTVPSLTPRWALIVAAALAVHFLWFRRERAEPVAAAGRPTRGEGRVSA
ncbi:MAG: hypothetical protein ICV64_08470 [Thermoleophilia bacterium]|nr:hypothetical protein [Thermoleophilia bacterium]